MNTTTPAVNVQVLTFNGNPAITMNPGYGVVPGTYQLNFQGRDVCGRKHTAPATLNVRCNNAPGT